MLYKLNEQQCRNLDVSIRREWVLPNGLGGYAMGTASGINTRRYHGHLIAAIQPPTHRMVLLAQVDAFVQAGGSPLGISSNQYPGAIYPEGFHYLRSFAVGEMACWTYRASGMEIVKRLMMHPGENAVTIEYENVGPAPYGLTLRPLVSHKPHHENFHETTHYPEHLSFAEDHTLTAHDGVELHLRHPDAQRDPIQGWYYRFEHQREIERGLPERDDLFCPCELSYRLEPGAKASLCASTRDTVPIALAEDCGDAEYRMSAMLKSAARKFFVVTPERTSIVAGYPWFTDWGRDTMISIPGLCIPTGKVAEGKRILLDYASQMKDGLIPNRFTEQGDVPDYNTVDATLWFGNAAYKLLEHEWDEDFAESIRPSLTQIYRSHIEGTQFGIKVDASDGLLTQGQEGVQLTWMDAKVGEWVVTPRHGKPVEINGLWINFLRIMEWLASRMPSYGDPSAFANAAQRGAQSFEAKFWHPQRKHYLDTVEPTDATLRPNQVIAMALPFSPVDAAHARIAMGTIGHELVTPNGLRTLGPKEPGYRGRFSGQMAELDAAYHQGTVWPWLLGSYATALVKYCDDREGAKLLLRNAKSMLQEYGMDGIAEVYDGDEPQSPGGCPWQAWSVAEILRAWVEDVKGD